MPYKRYPDQEELKYNTRKWPLHLTSKQERSLLSLLRVGIDDKRLTQERAESLWITAVTNPEETWNKFVDDTTEMVSLSHNRLSRELISAGRAFLHAFNEPPTTNEERKWPLHLTSKQERSLLSLLRVEIDDKRLTQERAKSLWITAVTNPEETWNKFVDDTTEMVSLSHNQLSRELISAGRAFLHAFNEPPTTNEELLINKELLVSVRQLSTNQERQIDLGKQATGGYTGEKHRNRLSVDEMKPNTAQVDEHQQRYYRSGSEEAIGPQELEVCQRQARTNEKKKRDFDGYSRMQDLCNMSVAEIVYYMKRAVKKDLENYIEAVRKTCRLKYYSQGDIETLVRPRLQVQEYTNFDQSLEHNKGQEYRRTHHANPGLLLKEKHIRQIKQIRPDLTHPSELVTNKSKYLR